MYEVVLLYEEHCDNAQRVCTYSTLLEHPSGTGYVLAANGAAANGAESDVIR